MRLPSIVRDITTGLLSRNSIAPFSAFHSAISAIHSFQTMSNPIWQGLETEMSVCCKCVKLLCHKSVDPTQGTERVQPRPIVPSFQSQPLFLIGQAPGLTEYRTGQPFRGDAGKGIRKLLADVGITPDKFDEMVYSAAIVRCFPGSKDRNGSREDERPSREMVRNCVPYLETQIMLFRPQVIITLGRFPLAEYLRLRGRDLRVAPLDAFVGTAEKWDNADVVFLPHTSGTSRWLNKPQNRQLLEKAKCVLRSSLLERNLLS